MYQPNKQNTYKDEIFLAHMVAPIPYKIMKNVLRWIEEHSSARTWKTHIGSWHGPLAFMDSLHHYYYSLWKPWSHLYVGELPKTHLFFDFKNNGMLFRDTIETTAIMYNWLSPPITSLAGWINYVFQFSARASLISPNRFILTLRTSADKLSWMAEGVPLIAL